MTTKRRLKELYKRVNPTNGKHSVLIFNKSNDIYTINLDGEKYLINEDEYNQFIKDYGNENVSCIIDDI